MVEFANSGITGWESFYVIVGSSGAALIGLQFVVIALIRDTRMRTTSGSVSAFGTPTVVHLGGALLIAAVMTAPWPALSAASVALTVCGLMGLGYCASVLVQARRQAGYQPVWQDWLWYVVLPSCAYGAVTAAALLVRPSTPVPLFVIAGATLGLLLNAIHNAWDTVTYIVIAGPPDEHTPGE